MALESQTPKIVRFGVFEVDLRAGELRKQGVKIKLQEQPFRVLTVLLQRPGEVVTREELRNQNWPPDTFVDFDNSLNTAINKLREALGDSADNPRFIETLPRRGYRFLAPVSVRLAQSPAPPRPATARTRVTKRSIIVLAAVMTALAIGVFLWVDHKEYFWRNPIADARFQTVTDFEGIAQDAAISRDGQFVAFLSDRDGPMDVWVTQVGSGQFHNLTHGSAGDLVNPDIRTLGFTPDGSSVTYWRGRGGDASGGQISIWEVPTMGGQPRLYLENVAEYDWSRDASRLVYHTPGPGDPVFVSQGNPRPNARALLTAPPGVHRHFPLWSPDSALIYFVQGQVPDKLDIWRVRSAGGAPERITSHNARVIYPVLLDRRTMLYLATEPDGSGPWLYGIDVERRIPHRSSSGLDRYTSLAASADGRRLVVTIANPKKSLWRMRVPDSQKDSSVPARIPLAPNTGFSPRFGPDYLLYISVTGSSQSIWKLANGRDTELWRGQGAQFLGAPANSADGEMIAFSVHQNGQTLLYVMQADGRNARIVADSLELRASPAWAPGGQSLICAAEDHGLTHLFRVPMDGRAPIPFVSEYSVDPVWSPDGRFVLFTDAEVGTIFSIHAVTPEAAPHALPPLTLSRGARHLAFLPGGRSLVVLKGELQHKNLWLIDLDTGAERQLTNLTPDVIVSDFDVSPDGREFVLERTQERADIAQLDLPRP